MTGQEVKEFRHLYSISAAILVAWTALVAGSLSWNIYIEKKQSRELATKEARTHFNKDNAFRFWGASHGGVYVPATDRTPPNKHLLKIPERDIVTPSGKKLTLMNPAYMVRQLMDDYADLYGVKGRITAFPDKLFNPLNKPDVWELKALNAFKKGETEFFEFNEIAGKPYLRLMRPLYIKESCLKCHGDQGYRVSDLRGGVGVSVPVSGYLEAANKKGQILVATHGLIWLLGLGSIVSVTRRSRIRAVERQVARDELLEAKMVAEQASNAKSEFLATMSHDLRTPLNAIMGFSSMMKDRTFGPLGNPRYEGYATDIHKSGKHLVSLINGILDLSKIEAGKYELSEETLDIAMLLKEAVDLIAPMADEKGLQFEVDIDPAIPKLYADDRPITQVFNNILSNAIKFTPQNGKVVVTGKHEDGDVLVVRVADDGIGMSEKDILKAMEPFEQAVSSQPKKHHGTGLGLYICANLMQLLGGSLNIESEIDRGTTVTLTFPSERRVVS